MVLNVKVKKNGQSHFEPGPLQQMPILVLDAFLAVGFLVFRLQYKSDKNNRSRWNM